MIQKYRTMRFQPLVLALGAAAQFVPNTATSGTAVESTEMDAMNQRFNNYLVNPKKYEPDYQAVISDRILGIIGSMEELQKLVPATAGIFNESIVRITISLTLVCNTTRSLTSYNRLYGLSFMGKFLIPLR